MGRLTNYAAHKVLTNITGETVAWPQAFYLALATANPGDAATGASMNELPNLYGYARQSVVWLIEPTGAGRYVTMQNPVNFPVALNDLSTATHWAVVDSPTYGAGNAWAYGELEPDAVCLENQIITLTNIITSGGPYIQMLPTTGASGFYTGYTRIMLTAMFGGGSWPYVNNHACLLAANGSEDGGGADITGAGYARVRVYAPGAGTPAWTVPANRAVALAHDVTFGPPTGNWTQAVAVGLALSAVTTVGPMFYDNAVADFSAVAGNIVRINAGGFAVTIN